MQTKNRIASFLMAVVMFITFAAPASAFDIVLFDNVPSDAEIVQVEGMEQEPTGQDSNNPSFDEGNGGYEVAAPKEAEDDKTEDEVPALGFSAPTDILHGYFFLECTPEQAALLYEYAKHQIANQPMFMPFAA